VEDGDEEEATKDFKTERQQIMRRGGAVDTILELVVRSVLAGVQTIVVIRWVIGRLAAVLEFFVELGLFILQVPS